MTGYRRRFPADEAGSLWLAPAIRGTAATCTWCAGATGRATPARILVGEMGGVGKLSDTPALAQSPSLAVKAIRTSARRFGELSRHGDDVDQRAIAPRR